MNLLQRFKLLEEGPAPKVDLGAMKKHSPRDYLLRFAFGAGIAAAAGVAGLLVGSRLGGLLLAFPAILPASLTLLERKDGRHIAAIDATGAIFGAIALIGFACVAAWGLTRFSGAIALAVAAGTWVVLAAALYVSIVWLPRRRKRPFNIIKPTST